MGPAKTVSRGQRLKALRDCPTGTTNQELERYRVLKLSTCKGPISAEETTPKLEAKAGPSEAYGAASDPPKPFFF